MTVARYSNEFRERTVARLLPPDRAELSRVSQKIVVSVATVACRCATSAHRQKARAVGYSTSATRIRSPSPRSIPSTTRGQAGDRELSQLTDRCMKRATIIVTLTGTLPKCWRRTSSSALGGLSVEYSPLRSITTSSPGSGNALLRVVKTTRQL